MDQEARRKALHELLVAILGTRNVYFQPPSSFRMQFPCIVYETDAGQSDFADNSPYRITRRYQVTVITLDPDSSVADKVEQLPLCTFSRRFASDNLNHFVYNLFF